MKSNILTSSKSRIGKIRRIITALLLFCLSTCSNETSPKMLPNLYNRDMLLLPLYLTYTIDNLQGWSSKWNDKSRIIYINKSQHRFQISIKSSLSIYSDFRKSCKSDTWIGDLTPTIDPFLLTINSPSAPGIISSSSGLYPNPGSFM